MRARNPVRIGFAGFVLVHSLLQAYRAATSGALPEAGLEAQPWFVALALLVLWLPFLFFAGAELMSLGRPDEPGAVRDEVSPQQRALEKVEPFALLIVLAFALLHGTQLAWPLLSGRMLPEDLRPELIAILSSTQNGLPWQAIAALASVGAASFYAVRQLQRALPLAGPTLARSLVLFGVSNYLLGAYAVIRCATGSLLP